MSPPPRRPPPALRPDPPQRPPARPARPARPSPGLLCAPGALDDAERAQLEAELAALRPIWEQRYSTLRPPPAGKAQHPLLRPVYWLGNWQFACLGYYEPPRKLRDKAVRAEPFPPGLQRLADKAEAMARRQLPSTFIPPKWRLNTCLVNLYGAKDGAPDAGRVGAHRDYEPGPVASYSLGERALFQFLPVGEGPPVKTMWLQDGDLHVISGPFWKDSLLHRVGRVEDKGALDLAPRVPGFRTRRINLTLRYVPEEHIVPFAALGPQARRDIEGYVAELASSAPFWSAALRAAGA
jgi:alkylated DNA repair dioxygenase AlkB